MAKPTPIPGTIAELEGGLYAPTKYEYLLSRHANVSVYRTRGYEALGEVKDSTSRADGTMIAMRKVLPPPPVVAKPPPPAAKPKPKPAPKAAAPRTQRSSAAPESTSPKRSAAPESTKPKPKGLFTKRTKS